MPDQPKNIRKQLQDIEALERCAEQCGVIGDLTKLKICYLLRHHPELSVTSIAELAGTSVSNASHSLRKLRAANLVTSRREAQTILYSLEPNAFDDVFKIIGRAEAS